MGGLAGGPDGRRGAIGRRSSAVSDGTVNVKGLRRNLGLRGLPEAQESPYPTLEGPYVLCSMYGRLGVVVDRVKAQTATVPTSNQDGGRGPLDG